MGILVLLAVLIVLTLIGLPLVYSLLASCIFYLLIFRPDLPFMAVVQLFVNGLDSTLLLAIVFFFLTGELMNSGGITTKLIDFAKTLVGSFKGGIAQVNILSSVLFSGITGSAVSDTAAVGGVMIPSMIKMGYSRPFSAAVTQVSSVIGPIIPPSIPVIVYAALAEVSVGKMFLAGIVPGVLISISLMITVYHISKKRNYPSSGFVGWGKVFATGLQALFALAALVIIVGGILAGIFTPTEAGAVAVFYSLMVGFFWYRELSLKKVVQSFTKAARGTSTVLVILGASNILAWILADLQVGLKLNMLIAYISSDPLIILILINVFIFIIGLFMDPLASLIIVVPVFLPTILAAGIDPIHFGIVVIFNLMIGLCTPPIGYLIYISADLARTKPEKVIRESLPFVLALGITLVILIAVPQITIGLIAWIT